MGKSGYKPKKPGERTRSCTRKGEDQIDWVAVREYYVTNMDESLSATARFFEISPMAVCARACAEGWVRERSDFTEAMVQIARESILRNFAAKVPQRWLQLYDALGAAIVSWFEGTAKFQATATQMTRMIELYATMTGKLAGVDFGIGLPYDASSRTAAKVWGAPEVVLEYTETTTPPEILAAEV